MLAIPIKFKFNIDSEARRVKETLDILTWLTKNNYKFSLPNAIKNPKETNIEIIREEIEEEYDLKTYQIAESAILKSWEGNSSLVKRINQKMVGSYALEEINVILTKYGTQGSYLTPNSVIINISNIPPEFLIKTVIHESLHLMIEHLIKKYSVEHWVKERIVDLIIDLEYKSRFKMQSVPEWAIATDKIFKENYPNLILMMEKASKISFN
ncbi:MAG: hypothetical protein COU71_01090 [Parcubacteria group bacterium CG10_big_fil_rev_8_21_14_0_10_38_31]|nr:MAG: hypothetical protein COU71_01090 [Parcubacteria group bacterium CG10_big_fil_rev_8_21_14_0_10_38_31]